MAKYTDPNTGVKYSTHMGLKVFTVIVVILLVISIVLNVVLYMQNSDDELDAESGELDVGDGEGGENDGDGEDGDGEKSDSPEKDEGSVLPPVNEEVVDTETIIKNEYAVRTSDFDEYGCATCIYYGFDNPPECEMYITKGGTVDSSPMAVSTQTLTAEDGSTDINYDIRASLVFGVGINDVKYTDYYYSSSPTYIEIVSLTGEPLEIESVEMRQYVYYELVVSGFSVSCTEYRSENGLELEVTLRTGCPGPDVTTNYTKNGKGEGRYAFYLTLSDGNTYSFDYWYLLNPDYTSDANSAKKVVDVA